MSWLLNLFVDPGDALWRIQRDADDSSVVGKSEFEREGTGILVSVIGIGLLVVTGYRVFRR